MLSFTMKTNCVRSRKNASNTDLSRDFMGLVVDGSMDLGIHIWHPPQIFLQGWMTSQRERERESLGSRLATKSLVMLNALSNPRLLLVL